MSAGVQNAGNFSDWLHRQETYFHRYAEEECNYNYSDEERAKRDERHERREKALISACAKNGLTVHVQGDPRGGAVRITFADKSSNNWGGEDWGIYW